MNKLKTLEDIAFQLTKMLRLNYHSLSILIEIKEKRAKELKLELDKIISNTDLIEIKEKRAKELKLELDKIIADTEQKVIYFKEKLDQLEDLLDGPIDIISSTVVQDVTENISDLHKTKKSIESTKNLAKMLNKIYRQKQLTEAGFNSYKNISKEINNLQSQKANLSKKFLGNLIFKKRIRDLSTRINSLYNLFYTKYDNIRLPDIDYLTNDRFNDVQKKAFERFTNELIEEYKSLSEKLSNKENVSKSMNPVIFESLIDDYISKYFKTRIEQKIEENKKRDDYYGKEAQAVLENTKLVKEALSVFREGLNQPHILVLGKSYTKEEEKKRRTLNSRLKALPFVLQNIVEEEMIKGEKTINEVFAEFGNYLTQLPIIIEKRKISTSFSKAKEYLLKALSRDTLSYALLIQKWDIERAAIEIENSLNTTELDNYFKELDMKKWDIFKNNINVQQLYGKEALELFNQIIRDEVFNRLLVTPEQTDESINLGYKALWFKDPNAVVYNILNFWREPGYSGERPFLLIHNNSENTLCAQYINSLTEKELKAVKQLKIPGVMEIIDTIREHPDRFLQSKFRKKEVWEENPIYEKVQENLGKICEHYLKHGSKEEKYFAVSVIVKLDFMRFSDKPSKQRDHLIEVLSEYIGLDNRVQANFKKHYKLFLEQISFKSRRSTNLVDYKDNLVVISNYFDNLKELIVDSQYPEKVMEEANSMQKYFFGEKKIRNLQKLIPYLRAFDSKIVQTQLANPEYSVIFKKRLWNLKEQIFRSKYSIEDVTAYIIADFTALKDFIDETNELIEKSTVKDALKYEQEKLLNSLIYRDDLVKETAYLPEYLRALNNNKTIREFAKKDEQTKINLEFLARTAYNCNKALVIPLIREAIKKDVSYEQLVQLQDYLLEISKFSKFISASVKERDEQKGLFDMLYELSTMEEDSLKLVSKINNGSLDFNLVKDSIKKLSQSSLRTTSYLVETLISAKNKDETIKEWLNLINSFAYGKFDATNELHKNLEYTRFREIVDNEKVRRHIKNHFTFTDYLSIFDRRKRTTDFIITKQDRFEIECVAEEAKILRDYVLSIKQKADELGREVFLIPNLSYGYLPVSPIIEELNQQGVKAIIGVKVGSTESHYNKEVLNSRLFKGYRRKIANEQPIIIVVDGTQHLVARDDQDKDARYPDAYQGYLNQVIAINDAMGFTEINYYYVGKTNEDMIRLRQTPEFKKLVEIYKQIIKVDTEKKREPYQFCLWNTAGMDLIIRNYHQKISKVPPTTPEKIRGPALIFCNVGLLDEQIPRKIKEKYSGLTHIPAYFDDSGKIINFNFGFDNFGVRYINTLETEIKKAFGSTHSKFLNRDFIPSLISYAAQQKKYEI